MRSLRLLPILVLVLASCDRQAPPAASQPHPAASPAQTPPHATPAARVEAGRLSRAIDDVHPVTDTRPVDSRVTDVKLSNASDGKHLTGATTDHFKPDDGVFIAIHTDGTAGTYTLAAKWIDGSGHTLTEYSQVIPKAGPVDTVFSLSKPDGWAKGAYQVELSINGKPMRTATFSVP